MACMCVMKQVRTANSLLTAPQDQFGKLHSLIECVDPVIAEHLTMIVRVVLVVWAYSDTFVG